MKSNRFIKVSVLAAIVMASSHSFAFDIFRMAASQIARDVVHTSYPTKSREYHRERESEASTAPSFAVPATGELEVAFSPNESSEALVVKAINSSQSEIRMLAYSFTSAPVVQALLNAKRRGVDIKLVADQKSNTTEDRSGKARAALSALANAGADVRLISAYAIHHDKTIVIDRDTVELGSFNYSAAAAHSNSENVLVNWHNPKLAAVYLSHFERNYRQSQPFDVRY